jgi:hypothetical protein
MAPISDVGLLATSINGVIAPSFFSTLIVGGVFTTLRKEELAVNRLIARNG